MGNYHQIPKCKDKKFSDPEFERLLRTDPDKIPHNLSSFHTRPAYAYTKSEVGGVRV